MLSLFLKLENVRVMQGAGGAQARREGTDDHSRVGKRLWL